MGPRRFSVRSSSTLRSTESGKAAQQLERPLPVPGGLHVGGALPRGATRLGPAADGIAREPRLVEVQREDLGSELLLALRAELLERPGNQLVHMAALIGRDGFVCRVSHQGVLEQAAMGESTRAPEDQPLLDQHVQVGAQVRGRRCDGLEDIEIELPSEECGALRRPLGRRVEAIESRGQQVAEIRGDIGRAARRVHCVGVRAADHPRQLFDEERDAVCALDDQRLRARRQRLLPRHRVDQVARIPR